MINKTILHPLLDIRTRIQRIYDLASGKGGREMMRMFARAEIDEEGRNEGW